MRTNTSELTAAESVAIDPGRKPTQAEFRAAAEQIDALLRAIQPLNVPAAGEVVGVMLREGKLSPLAIAWLATRAHVLFGSAEQRQRSGLPRDRDPLTRELREILGAKPRASTDEVIEALRRRAGAGSPIEDVNDDGTVTWFEAHELREATRKNIAKRISRLRPRTR